MIRNTHAIEFNLKGEFRRRAKPFSVLDYYSSKVKEVNYVVLVDVVVGVRVIVAGLCTIG